MPDAAAPPVQKNDPLRHDWVTISVMQISERFVQRTTWVVLSLCLMAANVWAQSLQVIELRHRTAPEVIPVLQPLLEPGGALSGQDYKLFVRTSPANLVQLRAALAQIDRQPQQLFVSVRRTTREQIERERAQASATVRSGDASVSVNERARAGSGASIRATDSSSRTEREGVASVRVLEGGSAFVSSGSSVPIVTAVAGVSGRRSFVAGATTYRNLGSGFVVTPRVNGSQVVLGISQQDERLVAGAVQTQSLATQVSGPVGEWIQLGGISESATAERSGVLSRQYATRSDERSIWVKVESE